MKTMTLLSSPSHRTDRKRNSPPPWWLLPHKQTILTILWWSLIHIEAHLHFIVWKHQKSDFLLLSFATTKKNEDTLFWRQCTFIHHWWYKILGKQIANIHKDFKGTYPSTQKFHFRNLAFWYTQSLQRIFIKILFVAVKLKEVPTKFWSYLNWYYQIALQKCSSLNSQPSPHL